MTKNILVKYITPVSDCECRTLFKCVEFNQNALKCMGAHTRNDRSIQLVFMEAKRSHLSFFNRIVLLRLCTGIYVEFYSDLEFYYPTMVDNDTSVVSSGIVLDGMLYIDSGSPTARGAQNLAYVEFYSIL